MCKIQIHAHVAKFTHPQFCSTMPPKFCKTTKPPPYLIKRSSIFIWSFVCPLNKQSNNGSKWKHGASSTRHSLLIFNYRCLISTIHICCSFWMKDRCFPNRLVTWRIGIFYVLSAIRNCRLQSVSTLWTVAGQVRLNSVKTNDENLRG